MVEYEFRDRDGVTWRIVYKSADADARVANGGSAGRDESLPGFEFTCSAITFRVPWPTYTDPRALRPRVIQRMIDRALGE